VKKEYVITGTGRIEGDSMVWAKKDLREHIYTKRHELDSDIKSEWDSKIIEKLLKSELYRKSEVIFTYISFEGEVDTIKFIERAISDHKTICVPKVISKKEGMEVYKISSLNEVEKGFHGILEPKSRSQLILPIDIDLLIIPGVAFDKTNGRIGYGGGFYDRYLKRIKAQANKIALAYAFQIFDSVPMDELDEKVDFIITNED
jgi:5-formyltetrahydrofolate cyclo-ligase